MNVPKEIKTNSICDDFTDCLKMRNFFKDVWRWKSLVFLKNACWLENLIC